MELEVQLFKKRQSEPVFMLKCKWVCSNNYPDALLKMPFTSVFFIMQGLTYICGIKS